MPIVTKDTHTITNNYHISNYKYLLHYDLRNQSTKLPESIFQFESFDASLCDISRMRAEQKDRDPLGPTLLGFPFKTILLFKSRDIYKTTEYLLILEQPKKNRLRLRTPNPE